ncbi:MAG TPA: zinc-ribbon domain-containing protein [Anaerovoracaceae bacterium]|nr:zinc-ribbon domain-containing protein [Anaerovoracaceae bacterium]
MNRICLSCGALLSDTAKFCKKCGTPATSENRTETIGALNLESKSGSVASITSAAGKTAKTFMASPKSGTFTLLTESSPAVLTNAAKATSAIELLSPLKVLTDGLISVIKGIKEAGKNKTALLTAILFGIGWLVLTLLPALGISVPPWLNFITFANGGLTGGIVGFVGGLLGKGLIVSLIVGIMSGNRLPKIGQKIKDSEQKTEIPNTFGLILVGVGTALILYNFMSGDGSPQNSIVGIVAAITAYRSQKQGGFLYKLANLLSARFSKTTLSSDAGAGRLITGLTTGFALGVPLSLLGISWICYLLGLLICIVGVVLSITATGSAGVAQQQ